MTNTTASTTKPLLQVKDCSKSDIQTLLDKYRLTLTIVDDKQTIPGSFWGDSEAGIISNVIYARNDTPIHSLLHETCHYICMDSSRRKKIDTNAGGDYNEENAVCYLQILLADDLPETNKENIMKDMDSWGYTFRLGSAKEWFEKDAEDATQWLIEKDLINKDNRPNYKLRIT